MRMRNMSNVYNIYYNVEEVTLSSIYMMCGRHSLSERQASHMNDLARCT